MMLENKVAVVTGAAQGIGREIALCFARSGADVAICDRDAEPLTKVRDEITALGRRACALTADVSSAEQVHDAVNKIIDSFCYSYDNYDYMSSLLGNGESRGGESWI